MLFAALAGEGFELSATGNPAEFFRIIEQHQPQVAVVDLTLDLGGLAEPVGGLGVLRRMRELCPGARRLVFSASTSQESIDRAFESGGQGYLFKSTTAWPRFSRRSRG